MKRIFRLLFAALLSLLILPTAAFFSSDEPASSHPFPTKLIDDLQDFSVQASKVYTIPAPVVKFVDSKAAGVTRKVVHQDDVFVEIALGAPLARPALQDRSELLKAIVGHEVGHAVMIYRFDEFPPGLILLTYASGLLALLAIWRSFMAMLAAAILMTLSIRMLMFVPALAIPHTAYLFFMGSLVLGTVLTFDFSARKFAVSRGFHKLAASLPSRKSFSIAAGVALPLFFVTSYLVGQQNIERELRADVFGACLTSPQTMREALLALTSKKPNVLREALDFYHPRMAERTALLSDLSDISFKERTCRALQSGKEPIIINRRTIQ